MAFFRRDGLGNAVIIDEDKPYYTLNGRSWSAEEIRRKSFADLHTLWYVVLRERNVVATQQREAKRNGLSSEVYGPILKTKDYDCRKTMARIKLVMNERRLAHLSALELMQPARNRIDILAQSRLKTIAPPRKPQSVKAAGTTSLPDEKPIASPKAIAKRRRTAMKALASSMAA
ncbi:mitochondrial 39-S ribosomal protein L47 (MRP-L47)-domain-containing protein [Auriculariales sp. MPI-PUGE-AT-0066]|nr:mitochondrial 39-S ribosomal protein L47 (MRP-L47)-domain-containing protein [Auriculariales sp. MPI-PUGE-AT-0066]